MKKLSSNFIKQVEFGALGAIIGLVAGFLVMMTYGGNFGCWPFVDTLFNLRGYESCGMFGGRIGLFLGALLGVWFAHKTLIKEALAFSRFKTIFLPLWLAILISSFGFTYLKSQNAATQRMLDLEKQAQGQMMQSGLIDLSVPVEIKELKQSPEMLEALFTQGTYQVSVRLMTGKVAEKWVNESEKNQEPPTENKNGITYVYPSQWSPHVPLITHFDYEKSAELSTTEVLEKNLFMAIEGLKILQEDERLMDAFELQVKELRSGLMFDLKEGHFDRDKISQSIDSSQNHPSDLKNESL